MSSCAFDQPLIEVFLEHGGKNYSLEFNISRKSSPFVPATYTVQFPPNKFPTFCDNITSYIKVTTLSPSGFKMNEPVIEKKIIKNVPCEYCMYLDTHVQVFYEDGKIMVGTPRMLRNKFERPCDPNTTVPYLKVDL